MKLFRNLLLVTILMMGTMAVNAQSKVAHINSRELIQSMPEFKQMQDELKKLEQEYKTSYETEAKALDAKMLKYQQEAPTQTDAENNKRAKETQEIRLKLQAYIQNAEKELANKQQALYKPMAEKAQKAIDEIAAAQGIEYVFDSTPGGGLIVAKGKDLMADVKAKLGI
ncbi:OmpH family outer membrane protein [Flavobacteriaceae bacterium F08102]|nr:OmpH family outer membrane protein [Flavobacteriaceae bacterium F08102]